MAKVIETYMVNFPEMKLIGIKYTFEDMQNGSFGNKWGEWFQKGYFEILEKFPDIESIDNGYVGFMRCNPSEYWIGMFKRIETIVPEGFQEILLPESKVSINLIQGTEPDIYMFHDNCVEETTRNHSIKVINGQSYFFELYNCPRFTTENEKGEKILDYGIYVD